MVDLAATETSLRGLLEALGTTLTDSERNEVMHFLDVGEYGVALETLCAIIEEEGKVIASETYLQIEAIGHRMAMDPATWTRIRPIQSRE
ncbi:MAG: MafI family immunity protein [Acidobacteriota bacterium]